ncbi:MAG: hypothetical protein A3J66_02300 [Candidatus Magasanikbacteria bacterium RIFCSPHIGHO2_02_FULL_47_14]|uniref:Uncharacterized protein n=1 Tax=Candidatus Magasanikbacteria bacterium RIFCSPHIGHO2_02_FULL_47_14 TaxID=1798680 RepID=A0A1F6M1B6_9BACT|nr:MAG: hypothetical protein A3J66_02300 [Candidatus Magasanikbacteria bacterium RIFCSPHIGHO2_02_FULL_47_14]
MFSTSVYNDPLRFSEMLKTKSEAYWQERGDIFALSLFHAAAEYVPAYKDFLLQQGIRPESVQTIQDFHQLPTLNKDNYLRAYPLEALCWKGKFKENRWTISTTSGSTGEPFYFPRTKRQDHQYALMAELYLRENFQIHRRSTLYIDAFPMGPWIGGVFTYEAIRMVAERGKYPLSIITTGTQKAEIIKTVRRLGSHFDQVLIGCYGPFLKDALDDGIQQGLDWSQYPLGFIFSAEGFTESFRDYVAQRAGLQDLYRGTLNHYGTVDLGTMAHETPLTILARRIAVDRVPLFESLFGQTTKLPTFCQFIPELFHFEEQQGGLVCTANSGLPLVRYDLKDHGGVKPLHEVHSLFREQNIDLEKAATTRGLSNSIMQLPCVFVYERSDFSVSLYAFQIYPETIRKALQHVAFSQHITGKFTMITKYDAGQNQYLEINIELRPGAHISQLLEASMQEQIVTSLLRESSEYAKTYSEVPQRVMPHLVFWPYEDRLFFAPGTKQHWVQKA